ncbi:hypothetical protein KVH08_35725, partial [Streptomyces olivaceus]|nr:hypothetical protein [Streptomyces olivaceus]MBZ6323898.1 hypothetical protein [Streptomyces olivaceus]
MPSHYDVLPDLAFGHHPVHGIVAANPKNLAASTWMLRGFDFHPVPDQPTLYALGRVSSRDHQRQRFELPPEHGRGMVLSSPALITKVGHVTAGS